MAYVTLLGASGHDRGSYDSCQSVIKATEILRWILCARKGHTVVLGTNLISLQYERGFVIHTCFVSLIA